MVKIVQVGFMALRTH